MEELLVYKYCSIEIAKLILSTGTLKFTVPLEFNDPFDCNLSLLYFEPSEESEKNFKSILKERYPHLNDLQILTAYRKVCENKELFCEMYTYVVREKLKISGVTCFSKRNDNTVMWSHYGDKHYGVCLGFDATVNVEDILVDNSINIIKEVNYDPKERFSYNNDKLNAIVNLYTTKSKDWSYEEEVRFVTFGGESMIKEFKKPLINSITFGCRCNKEDEQALLEITLEKGYEVKLERAQKNEFELKVFPT